VREATNLSWSEQPFGAGQRPFATPARMTAALHVEQVPTAGAAVPVAAAVVYLRTPRTGMLDLDGLELGFGFRVLATQADGEAGALAEAVDRDLVRCRRHAVVLAGHALCATWPGLRAATDKALPGVTTVADAWSARGVRERGTAAMLDTFHDAGANGEPIHTVAAIHGLETRSPRLTGLNAAGVASLHEAHLRGDAAAGESLMLACLVRALLVALVTARVLGSYRWTEPVPADRLALDAAWDCLPHLDPATLPPR